MTDHGLSLANKNLKRLWDHDAKYIWKELRIQITCKQAPRGCLHSCTCPCPSCWNATNFRCLEMSSFYMNLRKLFFKFPSGVYFQGTTIGMAPIMSMCTAEQSGGIVMVSQGHQGAEGSVPPISPHFSRQLLLLLDFVKLGHFLSCFLYVILPFSSPISGLLYPIIF